MTHDVFHTLCLSMLPKVGPATFWKYLEYFGSAEKALNAPVSDFASSLRPETEAALVEFQVKAEASSLARMARQDIELAEKLGIELLCFKSPAYPRLLAEIAVPPPLLYVRGNTSALAMPQIAIVGSRHATRSGLALAHEFAEALGRAGIVTTSGLALGIDSSAHRGSLAAGAKTIAVLGNGLSSVYPARNRELANQICESGGALVSEFALGVKAQASNFPRRNRIVSGLSCGTLVVEAALKSGSLITASYAIQQNREVFAIPGSPRNRMSAGCHSLIKNGAKLVESVEDIVEELGAMFGLEAEDLSESSVAYDKSRLKGATSRVFDCVGFELITENELLEALKIGLGELSAELVNLEMQGLIENTGLGYRRI
jgi:DNA processing protein